MGLGLWRYTWMKLLFPQVKWEVTKSPHVYLTFDDGPHPIVTPKVLRVLKAYGIKATFFCVGKNAHAYPELIEALKKEGHCIGNHTFAHEKGWKTGRTSYLRSVDATGEILESKLFRPPYGKINPFCIRALKKRGYQIIMWSWLSRDYNRTISNQQIVLSANGIKAGDIMVFHDSQKTADRIETLLHEIIPMIQAKKLTFRTFVDL